MKAMCSSLRSGGVVVWWCGGVVVWWLVVKTLTLLGQ